ncbi:hypothetical protein NHQ30_010859 [Ciborinia camelliae]|nr:hypothetical protein NHQ30_010859 [Ciborinia camelliae]
MSQTTPNDPTNPLHQSQTPPVNIITLPVIGNVPPVIGNAPPINGNGNAPPVNGNGNAPPLNGNGNAAPINGNGNAAPINGNGNAAPVNGNGNAAPANGNHLPVQPPAPRSNDNILLHRPSHFPFDVHSQRIFIRNPRILPRELHLNQYGRPEVMHEPGEYPTNQEMERWKADVIDQIQLVTRFIQAGLEPGRYVEEYIEEFLGWRNTLCIELERVVELIEYLEDVLLIEEGPLTEAEIEDLQVEGSGMDGPQ